MDGVVGFVVRSGGFLGQKVKCVIDIFTSHECKGILYVGFEQTYTNWACFIVLKGSVRSTVHHMGAADKF